MNGFLVENARNILENADIDTFIKNHYLSSGFGEISGIDSWPELWVRDGARKAEAMALLKEAGIGIVGPKVTGDNMQVWTCPNCREEIEVQFSSCWNCNTDKPQTNQL